jgi:hypothetical protein
MVLQITCQMLHLRICQSQKEYFPKTKLSQTLNVFKEIYLSFQTQTFKFKYQHFHK